MIANSELFLSASLLALRQASVRAFGPAPALAAAAQSGLGKSENRKIKKLLHCFQCKSNLTILESTNRPQNPHRFFAIFLRKTALFRPQKAQFWPQNSLCLLALLSSSFPASESPGN
jgi:hypothetical protein